MQTDIIEHIDLEEFLKNLDPKDKVVITIQPYLSQLDNNLNTIEVTKWLVVTC